MGHICYQGCEKAQEMDSGDSLMRHCGCTYATELDIKNTRILNFMLYIFILLR